jgi:ABC-type branched-subunit amino acid transport system substrate-binding protein
VVKVRLVRRGASGTGLGRAVPLLALVLLAASPFAYRALPSATPLRLTKATLLVAFSGQLHMRGNDLYAATQLAVRDVNGVGTGSTLAVVSALDDQGQPSAAADQAMAVAAAPDTAPLLCCTTAAAETAVSRVLPGRHPLLSLQATSPALPAAEARLAAQQFGLGRAVVLSDVTIPGAGRSAALVAAFQTAGYQVTRLPVNFATGSESALVAASVQRSHPTLIVLDTEYPAAATLGTALRTAGVTAPLLGDDRLDGAPAAAVLGSLSDVWYAALDQAALLPHVPATFPAAYLQLRGHAPSSRDILAYLQTRAALQAGVAPVIIGQLPVALYKVIPGAYPGRRVAGPSRGAVR